MGVYYLIFLVIVNVHTGFSDDASTFLTQTVYGFLDFTTTIGNTVMVFSPQSAPTLDLKENTALPKNIIETKPISSGQDVFDDKINPTKLTISVKSSTNKFKEESLTKKLEEVNTATSNLNNINKNKKLPNANLQNTIESVHQIKNIVKPEYDLLSRQPAEYAEETYRIVNLKTSSRVHNHGTSSHKRNPSGSTSDNHATGLVTKLSETVLKDGVTTVHETSVIGTYISGKYAQLLQSSSNIHKNKKPKIRPTSSLRVLKTVAPLITNSNAKSAHSTVKTSHRQSSLSNRVKKKNSSILANDSIVIAESLPTVERKNSKKTPSRSKSKRRNKGSRTSNSHSSTVQSSTSDAANRRAFRTKVQASPTESDTSTSLYMFKLNRTPGRWQYKSSPKPRITIRKQTSESSTGLNNVTASAVTSIMEQINNENPNQNILDQGDLVSSGSQSGAILNNIDQENKQKNFVETLNVEISTPVDFKDTYYEIATIKTPFTFQVGVVKKTRYITVTSTFEKVIQPEPTAAPLKEGPLTENILIAPTKADNFLLDGSITTLLTLHLSEDMETPNLETVTESYSITQTKLRTQILPIVRDYKNETTYVTLVQTYDITSLITATKTISPLEDNQFIPSKNFKDFGGNLEEAGSEINLELEFGDEDNAEELNDDHQYTLPRKNILNVSVNKNQPSADISKNLNPDQINQLALLNLYQPAAPLSTVITRTQPVIKQETVWESHVIPIVNGLSTNYRTLSKSVGVVDKTEYILDTTTLSLPPVPPPVSVNPYLLPIHQQHQQQQHYQPITSSIVHQTIITQTNSKILKLTFGAKTAYTTVYSTEVIPTTLTMFITTSMPVQPSAFPGYFPPPYPPYAYVG